MKNLVIRKGQALVASVGVLAYRAIVSLVPSLSATCIASNMLLLRTEIFEKSESEKQERGKNSITSWPVKCCF